MTASTRGALPPTERVARRMRPAWRVAVQSLAEGEQLEFRVTTDPKTGKMKAVDVTGPDGAYVQGAPREPRYDDDEYY